MHAAGQKKALEYFRKTLAGDSFPPAVLLYGPAGSGKSLLAEDFARQWLCLGEGERPCGSCASCRESASFRHPDFILFSAKDLKRGISAWLGLLEEIPPGVIAARTLPFLYRIEQAFIRAFMKIDNSVSIKGKAGRAKTEKLDKEALAASIYDLERVLTSPDATSDALSDTLNEMIRLAGFLHNDILRIDGVREISNILSRRPLLGGRRIVLIESADKLNQSSANAFLKTLEEASSGTTILLTAPSLESVLPTIRSRCALVPVFKLRGKEMEEIAATELGIKGVVPAEGCPGFIDYLEKCGGGGANIKTFLLRFFDELEAGNRSDKIFSFVKEVSDSGAAPALLAELESLFSQVILARQLGVGADALFVRLLEGVALRTLRSLRQETETLLARLPVFHLNKEQALLSVFFGLFKARWGG